MISSDILIVGGGIAGLSAAAVLARHGRVSVVEAEAQVGYHSSGRSATMVHYALGDRLVRALTFASRRFFDCPPDEFTCTPLGQPMPVLVHARENERDELFLLEAEIARFAPLERLDHRTLHELCPLLKDDAVEGIVDPNGLRLDPHALLQGNVRELRRLGSQVYPDSRVGGIRHANGCWTLTTHRGERFTAPLLVNAAGSWADELARLAGLDPLGLTPLRRTIITFDAPAGTKLEGLPFAKTIHDELYFAPESGRLFASPMDEVPSNPCDAQPDEFEVALAAHRMEERTLVKVERVHSRWAGLRTFALDRHPAVGFAEGADGFFWLAGQGGYGLQTSPAVAAVAEALITSKPWPLADVTPQSLSPLRLIGQQARVERTAMLRDRTAPGR